MDSAEHLSSGMTAPAPRSASSSLLWRVWQILKDTVTIVWDVIRSLVALFRERPAQIIGSSFLLLMLWGYHGELELLNRAIPDTFVGPGKGWSDQLRLEPPLTRPRILEGIPWDQELISFGMGLLLLVGIPILIIRFGFKERLADYGLGLPPKGHRKVGWLGFIALMLICIGPFYLGTLDNYALNSMQQVYPLYRPFADTGQFILYELSYLPFFIAIEFIFRGYLLFGLSKARDLAGSERGTGIPGPLFFGTYALLIQMLSYTAWHLGKPIPELWGTVVWGLVAGAIAYRSRSIWPVMLAHYLLNVFMDYMILHHLGIWRS